MQVIRCEIHVSLTLHNGRITLIQVKDLKYAVVHITQDRCNVFQTSGSSGRWLCRCIEAATRGLSMAVSRAVVECLSTCRFRFVNSILGQLECTARLLVCLLREWSIFIWNNWVSTGVIFLKTAVVTYPQQPVCTGYHFLVKLLMCH